MKVLIYESSHIDAIEIRDIIDNQNGYIQLNIRDLTSGATSELLQILDETNKVLLIHLTDQ